jgi:hypothetical protein
MTLVQLVYVLVVGAKLLIRGHRVFLELPIGLHRFLSWCEYSSRTGSVPNRRDFFSGHQLRIR